MTYEEELAKYEKDVARWDKAREALRKRNETKIAQFNRLPFWKKWGGKHEELKMEIIHSWEDFGRTAPRMPFPPLS